MLSALINSGANLVKKRPALVEVVMSTLMQWTPVKLEGQPASVIRSIEKSIRILLNHISRSVLFITIHLASLLPYSLSDGRTPQGQHFQPQIHAALANQATRMEQAAADEKARKAAEASRKRQTAATPVAEAPDSKRPKLEHDATAYEHLKVPISSSSDAAPVFEFSALPASLVTDLIVANLQAFTENALIGLVQAYRHKKSSPAAVPGLPTSATPPPVGPSRPVAPPAAATAAATDQASATPPPAVPRAPPSAPRADRERKQKSATPPPPPVAVKQEEPLDPLKMDIDDEEMEYEPDRLNLEVGFCFLSSSALE